MSYEGKLWWARMGQMPGWILANGIPVWRQILVSTCPSSTGSWPIPRTSSTIRTTTASTVARDGHQLRDKSRGDQNAAKSLAKVDEVELWSRSVQGVEKGEERGENGRRET